MIPATAEDEAVERLFGDRRLCPRMGYRAMGRLLMRVRGPVALQEEAARACRIGAQEENKTWRGGRGR